MLSYHQLGPAFSFCGFKPSTSTACIPHRLLPQTCIRYIYPLINRQEALFNLSTVAALDEIRAKVARDESKRVGLISLYVHLSQCTCATMPHVVNTHISLDQDGRQSGPRLGLGFIM